MRAIAVVSVVANHLVGRPVGGYVGVDVFFVISGYLISGLLLREHARNGSISITGFYRRRVKRIVPAAVLTVFLTCTLAPIVLGFSRGAKVCIDGVWALLFAGNWRQYLQGSDYFARSQQPSPLQHYWSLGVEEQFYVVWPWVLIALFAVVAVRRTRLVAGLTMAVIVTASFAWAVQQSAEQSAQAYFSSFTRAWELGVGALVAIVAPVSAKLRPSLRPLLAWCGLLGIGASVALVHNGLPFPGPWAGPPVISTAIVILAGEGGYPARHMPLLTNRLSSYLGDISYSMYLVHYPAIIFLTALIDTRDPAYPLVATGAIIVLSMLSYHLVESPVRHSRWLDHGMRRLRRRGWPRPLTFALVLLFAYSTTIVVVIGQLRSTPAPSIPNAVQSAAPGHRGPCFGAAATVDAGTCTPLADKALYPGPQEAPDDMKLMSACFVLFDSDQLNVCHEGVADNPRYRIALVGDSHAAVFRGALSTIATQRRWQVDIYSGAGCRLGEPFRCPTMDNTVQTIIDNKYDLVVTTGFFDADRADIDGASGGGPEVARQMSAAWSQIIASGSRFVVIADVPQIDDDTYHCETLMSATADSECSLSRSESVKQRTVRLAVDQTKGAELLDLTDVFCDKMRCKTIIGNVIVYADTYSHLTDTFSKTLGPYLGDALELHLPKRAA